MSDNEEPTLLLIDGHSLAFRAFYALPVESFQNRDGQHTNAIHGFIAMLLLLLAQEKPTHLAVAFDISRYSFRTREYPDYKGTRGETPPEFIGQVPLLEEALHAMNIATLSKEDFEADDILATLATQGAEKGFRVLVVSGDRDAIQLVNDRVTLLYPAARGVSELKRYDPESVFTRYGVTPEKYSDVAALVGEKSDNLTGIDKVGEKTAVKWITTYGSLDEVLKHADEITGVVGHNLREQKKNAIRNRTLNRLRTDVELPLGPNDVARKPIDVDAVRTVFDKLQFKTLLKRVLAIAAADQPQKDAVDASDSDDASVTRVDDAVCPPVVRTLVDEELAHWLAEASASGTRALAIQIEHDRDTVTGFGLSTRHESAWVPWAVGRPDYDALTAWLASNAPKIMCDAKPQLKALAANGIELHGIVFDTLVAVGLIRAGAPHSTLADQVTSELGERISDADPTQLLPEHEPLSPATEAWYVWRLEDVMRPTVMASSKAVFDDIELPLIPVLARMERAGVAVNRMALATLRGRLTESADRFATRAFAEIGHEVNLSSPKQLQGVLFDELNMPKTRSMKTGFSTDAAALTELQNRNPHPFLELLLQHRDAVKLKQIIETLERAVGDDDRIHTRYDQVGTSTGRISSADPNLQNIPVRTEIGREIRAAFECGPQFETLLTADYSQIEMRIMAHLSGDAALIAAFEAGEDLHRAVGARIYGVAPADVSGEMRSRVKAMSYGLAYGLSAFGLSKQLRISSGEAKQLMTDYFERFGAVREYLRDVVEKARVDGFTETIFHRRRLFSDLSSSNRLARDNAERAALNAPIQGSAADIMKIAMTHIDSDICANGLESRMLLQVHDELIFEVAPGEWDTVRSIVVDRMSHAAELRVPLDVQVGRGVNWDQAAH